MAKPDEGHILTEKALAKLEKKIASVYGEAAKEMQTTIDEYFSSFSKRDEEMRSLIGSEVNGKGWTKEDYKKWRLNQIGRGKRMEALRDKIAERVTEANETAVAYVNDATPGIYSLNRNYTAYTIEQISPNADFTLWDEQTVKRLITENPDLMPYYPKKMALKRGIDLEYGKKQITASITSSILQGKSIKHIADDLQERITTISRASAIRTARTAVTGAQNAGRMDSYKAAEGMGIKLQKQWLSTLDNRTRHAHAMLDGQTVDTNKPFKVDGYELMYPGDRSAPGYLLYNCRCTTIAVLDDVDTSDAERWSIDPETGERKLVSDMTYQEWAGWKEKEQKTVANSVQSGTIKAQADPPVTLADCSTDKRKYDFSNGGGGVRKQANAVVYKTPDGVEFVFPDRYDTKHQTMTPELAVETYYQVPEKLRKMGQKQIIFQDVYNPQDAYWKKVYKKFTHSYATGGDTINFWRHDYQHNKDYLVRTFCHEMAHKVDKDNSVGTDRFSQYTWWVDAMAQDEKLSGQKSPTKYGENANAEDFAESFAEYVKDPTAFKSIFPNRAKIIEIFLR